MKYKIEDGRVVALKSFNDIREGDIGGMVDGEHNLSQEGTCWVSVNAQVYGSARVFGSAQVFGNARVFGNAQVYGSARVFDDALVSGNAVITLDCNTKVIVISGLRWHITIYNGIAKVGCKCRSIDDWLAMSEDEIKEMDNDALWFYKSILRPLLLTLDQR